MIQPVLHSRQLDEIIHLPTLFAQALSGPSLPAPYSLNLASLNLYGWAAYTHYDLLLDHSHPVNSRLVAATTIYRRFLQLLNSLTQASPSLAQAASTSLNRQETVMVKEINQTSFNPNRVPKNVRPLLPSDQADRALGHLICLLVVLNFQHFRLSSPVSRRLIRFFRLYLLVRQLLDDAHDWEEDWAQGRLTSTLALLFQSQSPSRFNPETLQTYRLAFWDKVTPVLMKRVLRHCRRAENTLQHLPLVDRNFFLSLIRSQAAIAQDTLNKRQTTLDFIQTVSG